LGGTVVRRRGRRPEEGRRVTKSLCGADSVGGAVVTVGDDARRKVAAGRVGGGVLEVEADTRWAAADASVFLVHGREQLV
jgi:hypothetical protein